MLHAVVKKSWKQHPTKQQLYAHLPSLSQTIQVRRVRHVGYCWRNKEDELMGDVLQWIPTHRHTSVVTSYFITGWNDKILALEKTT